MAVLQDQGIGPGELGLQLLQVGLVAGGVGLLLQVLDPAFERETGLARLVFLQGLQAEVGEELHMQLHQHVADFLDPALGFVGG
ncbi:hypothetical protein FQZ97_1206930 [compost metagenome]